MQKEKLRKITVTALFSALAFLMTFILRFKVGFLTFDFKDAVISIISLMYGPIYGLTSAGMVSVLEFLSVSDTGVYGLIMNFISSGVFAVVCGTVYEYRRSFNGAIIAVAASVVGVTVVMTVANILITPFYMGVSKSDVIAIIPTVLLPFNICKSIINASSLLIIYKPITTTLKKAGVVFSSTPVKYSISKKSIFLIIVSSVILIAAVLFIIIKMGGSFSVINN